MSRELTPQSSFDGLRKEAKRWLKALRDHDAEALARFEHVRPHAPAAPTLRDIQHALALEHGLSGWTELKTRLATSHQPQATSYKPTLARYEEMAEALLDAYCTGTPEALERHWKFTWHRRNWQAMRTYVQVDLGRRRDLPEPTDTSTWADVEISLEDARFLVAREHDFPTWQALADYVAALPPGSGEIAAKPVTLFTTDGQGARQTAGHGREWDAVLSLIAEKHISGLDANGQMTDSLLERVSRLDAITSLDLHGSSRVTDDGLRCLANMPQLQHLRLNGTAISDAGMEALRQLTDLRSIDFSSTQITDAGAAHLAQCDRLERVDLTGTRTGDGALRALGGKPGLAHFRSGNEVSDAGIALIHQFPAFKTWKGGDIGIPLLEYFSGPTFLSLHGSFTDQGAADLAGLDGLFALSLDDSKLAITSACLAPLASLPNLGWLAFDATDDAMPFIAALPHLRILMCQDTQAGDDGFVALSRSQSIEKIWGRRCYNLKAKGFTALAEMPALRQLSVSCKNVDDAGLSALPRFPALRELMPMDVPDAGYRHIGRCDDLEALLLMYCRETTDAATERITCLRKLRKYFASYTLITDRTPQLLSQIASLEDIEINACASLTNAGIAALARLPRLRELRATGMPNVTAEIVAAFPAGVRVEVGV